MHIAYFFVWIGGLAWLFFLKGGMPYRIIGWIYLTVVVLLIASSGKDYYTLGLYPMLIAAGGVWLEGVTVKRVWLRYVAVTFMLIVFLAILPLLLPVWKPDALAAFYKRHDIEKTGALHWEDQENHELPQDFADMISWRELGDKVSKAYNSLPDSIHSKTFIYCRNYALAGAVTYYGKNIPKPVSDNASFLIWMPEKYTAKHLLFVGKRIPAKDDEVFQQYERYTILDSTTTPMAREKGVKIILYENGNDKVDAMIDAGIKKKKDEYRR